MGKRSTILRNWPKYLLQWGVLVALIIFITGLVPSETAVDPEAYCPMGAHISARWTRCRICSSK